MQPEMRGSIEQYIDFALSDAQMLGYQRYIKTLKPYVKSIEDAVFGLVVGTIIASCLDQFILSYRRPPTPSEMDELQRIIKEKIPKIRSRILETFV